MSPPESSPLAPLRPTSTVPVAISDVAAHLSVPPPTGPGADLVLTGVSQSSASVRPGDLYAALPGGRTHGVCFVQAAAAAGAVAVLTDSEGGETMRATDLPCLIVPEPRRVLGSVASLIYGNPAHGLILIGVTGTSGKTTTTQLIYAGGGSAERRTAVIGTMGTWIDGTPVKSALTTPEAPDLHALFGVMREQGVEVCAIEVSSHAIVMGRVDGVVFDLAVFTNFGRDHLDFHAGVEEYFAAKAELFTPARAKRALLCADDPYVARLLADPQIPTHTFSASKQDADWWCHDIAETATGSRFRLRAPDGQERAASVGLVGAFNVMNAVAAIAAIAEVGIDVAEATAAVADVSSVAGRMESIAAGQPFSVIVDYAHKPDALAACLRALRPITSGRLVLVIGAGGDRDQGKRPQMGEIAARLADSVIVTDDNPRSESPAGIRAELLAGAAAGPGQAIEIGDRRRAIEQALTTAQEGDTVLIAGKGHETSQDIAGTSHAFDDREVTREILSASEPAGTGR